MSTSEDLQPTPRFLLPDDATFRDRAEQYWLRLLRSYTYNTPLRRGKYRLSLLGQRACRNFPKRVVTPARDGRTLEVSFSPMDWDTIFFFGEYESQLTSVVSAIVEPGDVCFDVGANLGWYTTLFSRLVGPAGQVHSFEPVPPTFAELKRNVERLNDGSNISINNLALGDSAKVVSVGFGAGQSTGYASIATSDGDPSSFRCEMVTLSDYLAERPEIGEVTFLKADIEGAELMMFRGAEAIFRQERAPILLVEMAADRGSLFGYTPNDLLYFISERGDYRFVAFEGEMSRFRFREIERFEDGHPGGNVFCLPRSGYEGRFGSIEWSVR